MADTSPDERTQALIREVAALMGRLFIARRDRKAVYRPDHTGKWHWTAVDEPYRMQDFVNHLTGQHCLGTYLLDQQSNVKFMAFDIDVRKEGKYLRVYDIEQIVELESRGYLFDMDIVEGPMESAFHDPTADAHRWTRLMVLEHVRLLFYQLCKLKLPSMVVITGGGAHVIASFPEPVPAEIARSAGIEIVANITGAVQRNDMFFECGGLGELTIEVFPKQDRLNGDGYGNLLRLPFGLHREAKIRTYSIDPTAPTVPMWEWKQVSSTGMLRGLAQYHDNTASKARQGK